MSGVVGVLAISGGVGGAGAVGAGSMLFSTSKGRCNRGADMQTSEIFRDPSSQEPHAGRTLTQRICRRGAWFVAAVGWSTLMSSTQSCPPGSQPAPPSCTGKPMRWEICRASQSRPQELWSQRLLISKKASGLINSVHKVIHNQSRLRRRSEELACRRFMAAKNYRLLGLLGAVVLTAGLVGAFTGGFAAGAELAMRTTRFLSSRRVPLEVISCAR